MVSFTDGFAYHLHGIFTGVSLKIAIPSRGAEGGIFFWVTWVTWEAN